uniref:NTP transferase domain-containing protein n=1 Tax=Lachnospira sp. TaxID=2049031 RepID=UPI003FEFCE37
MDNCYLDALAVITFFKMSDKKHLFITGERGNGKSYLLNSILNQLEETMDMSDFFNFNYLLSRRTDTPEVVIKSNLIDDGKEYVIGRPRTLTPVPPKNGNNMTIVEDGFINCACPAIMKHLMTSADSVFVIDELGYLESSCGEFQEHIRTLLDNSRVLAVIRKQSTEFLDSIKSRSDVLLIDIDNTFSSISCIIMASGMSKRFGTNKLLAPFNNNTLFENAINISRFVSFGKTLAVTRHDELVQICEREHIHCIKHNMPYRNDMVRLGVSHILRETHKHKSCCTQGILFLPSDQPLITKTSLQLLCLLFIYYNNSYFACNSTDKSSNANNDYSNNNNNNNKICRLAFNENAGAPVIFPACYYNELLTLPQGKGGGFIAKKHPAQVVLVPAQDEYELFDIDTPDDLIRLSQYPC